mmetsp:Transcript_16895/g.53576  ORF Transcript_16895/g.53576 Transcript_16895/m.53576 type:complete len:436 (+) Transcript_16895:225-1532(+)
MQHRHIDKAARRAQLEGELARLSSLRVTVENKLRQAAQLRASGQLPEASGGSLGKRTPKANQLYAGADGYVPLSGSKRSRSDMGGSRAEREKRMASIWNGVKSVLSQTMKHRQAWPFHAPVDPVVLNLPDYFQIVKKPMDLGTVSKRLERQEYATPFEILQDIRLVFDNCRLYNKAGSDVRIMGDTVSDFMEKKWAASKIEERMQAELLEMDDDELVATAGTELFGDEGVWGAAKPSQVPAERAAREMTFDEKRKLSQNLGDLPSDKLGQVVAIVGHNGGEGEEIELDIDSLPNETLWKLHAYVGQCMKARKKSSARPAASQDDRAQRAADAVDDTRRKLLEAGGGAAGAGAGAPTPADDIDIGFGGGGGGGGAAPPPAPPSFNQRPASSGSSSSSDDSSSGSDSGNDEEGTASGGATRGLGVLPGMGGEAQSNV